MLATTPRIFTACSLRPALRSSARCGRLTFHHLPWSRSLSRPSLRSVRHGRGGDCDHPSRIRTVTSAVGSLQQQMLPNTVTLSKRRGLFASRRHQTTVPMLLDCPRRNFRPPPGSDLGLDEDVRMARMARGRTAREHETSVEPRTQASSLGGTGRWRGASGDAPSRCRRRSYAEGDHELTIEGRSDLVKRRNGRRVVSRLQA